MPSNRKIKIYRFEDHKEETVGEFFAIAYKTLGSILGNSDFLFNLAAPVFNVVKEVAKKLLADGAKQSDLMFTLSVCNACQNIKITNGFLDIGFEKIFIKEFEPYEKIFSFFLKAQNRPFEKQVAEIIAAAAFFGLLAAKEGKSWQNYISDMAQWVVPKP